MNLSEKALSINPSPTLAITQKATELKEAGVNVISLSVGEPDFNTPEFILDAAKEAMNKGLTKYTSVGGVSALKEAIQYKMKNDHQLQYDKDEIIVTTGAKFALYLLFQALLNKGDEVVIPTPYWVSYPDQVKLAGGKPVFINGYEDNDFKIKANQLEEIVTNKTKAIVLNSPSNPTGMMYTKEELEEIGEVCIKHGITIISDEIYEKLIYSNEKHVSIASLSKKLKDITIVINGVSKSHAMTGWRIGYACGPKSIIKAIASFASQTTSNPSSISQYATISAYTDERANKALAEMNKRFKRRLDTLHNLLIQIPGISCKKPQGAFYLFPNISEAIKLTGFKTSDEWCQALLEEEHVAIVPGSGFGVPSNVRLSYATSLENIEDAANRIKRFVERHMRS